LNVVAATPASNLTTIVKYELPAEKAACKMIAPDDMEQLVELLHNEAKMI
jgi:electron transfer flavoprotein beta subunit